MTEAEQRRSRIGGSDVAAILGLSKYRTKLGVYLEKKSLIPPPELKDIMHVGLLMEPVLDRVYRLRVGNATFEPQGDIRHRDLPFFGGHPDRITRDRLRLLEMKTAGLYMMDKWGEPGTNEIPIDYLVQCCCYEAITDIDICDVIVSFLPKDEREFLATIDKLTDVQIANLAKTLPSELYHVERDHEFEQIILNGVKQFWFEHIIPGVMPPLDGSQQCKLYLDTTYKTHNSTIINATDAHDAIFMKFLMSNEGEQETYKNIIKDIIGHNEGIQFEGAKVTWKARKDGVRVFRVNMKGA